MDERPLRERLAEDVGWVERADLAAHAKRGGLVLVDAALALLDVAEAIGEDRGEEVAAWISTGQITRPSAAELGAETYTAVVVQPYVLAQALES
jgi:hypothetical protein